MPRCSTGFSNKRRFYEEANRLPLNNKKLKKTKEEEEIEEEITKLYAMLKRRYARLNEIRTRKAIEEEKKKLRRETRFLLPMLEDAAKEEQRLKNQILDVIDLTKEDEYDSDELDRIEEQLPNKASVIIDQLIIDRESQK